MASISQRGVCMQNSTGVCVYDIIPARTGVCMSETSDLIVLDQIVSAVSDDDIDGIVDDVLSGATFNLQEEMAASLPWGRLIDRQGARGVYLFCMVCLGLIPLFQSVEGLFEASVSP